MICPECGSEELVKESGSVFCKRCGLELDELVIVDKKKGKHQVVDIPTVFFEVSPQMELYALKVGLDKDKLVKGWEKILGFRLGGRLEPGHKQKASEYITAAIGRNTELLSRSLVRARQGWSKINNKYFVELEKVLGKSGTRSYKCYLSLVFAYSMHNSSKNFVMINHKSSFCNFMVGKEIFCINYRRFVKENFKEGYTQADREIERLSSIFVLLMHPRLRTCFEIRFSTELFKDDDKLRARELWELYKNSPGFSAFLDSAYSRFYEPKTKLR